MKRNGPLSPQLLEHLWSYDQPIRLQRTGDWTEWSDEALHRAAYAQDPELYGLLAVSDDTAPWQQLRMLFLLLQSSRAGMPSEQRRTLERVTDLLAALLHPDQVLMAFLALRRARANHKHTVRAILGYILNHPALEDMARRRRPALLDSLEHALGKNVARACASLLASAAMESGYLRRHLLRFARDRQRLQRIIPQLYGLQPGAALVATAEEQVSYSEFHERYLARANRRRERPQTVTATNRGDISATLIHLYRGGLSEPLLQALDRYVESAARRLPYFAGRVALVLDASASTRSYGDREFCYIAQSVALQRVLARCCADFRVHQVGGAGPLPEPVGASDLAGALLDALEDQPALVAIVSDGYENIYPGDLARVMASLPQAGIQTPVVFCHSKFTAHDDLSLRRPDRSMPQLEFWHQDDFEGLLLRLFTLAEGDLSAGSVREFLGGKLARIEEEVEPWTTRP